MRHIYIGTLVAIAALVAGVILLFGKSPYYPVVRIKIPGGVTMTFIGQPWSSQEKCAAANDNTVAAIRAKCAQCNFDLVACPIKLEAMWADAMSSRATGVYAVHTEIQRILIEPPTETAREICTGMAEQITHEGKLHGRCIAPSRNDA